MKGEILLKFRIYRWLKVIILILILVNVVDALPLIFSFESAGDLLGGSVPVITRLGLLMLSIVFLIMIFFERKAGLYGLIVSQVLLGVLRLATSPVLDIEDSIISPLVIIAVVFMGIQKPEK